MLNNFSPISGIATVISVRLNYIIRGGVIKEKKIMVDFLIYIGFGVMLVGALFGIVVAVKGMRENNWADVRNISLWSPFHRKQLSPLMRRLTGAVGLLMLAGMVLAGIGIIIELKI